MRRLSKEFGSKRAFTLVEIVLVLGIIVILAAALFMGITDLMQTASDADDAVARGSSQLDRQITDSEQKLADYKF